MRPDDIEVNARVVWSDGIQVVLHDPGFNRRQVLGSLLHAVWSMSLQVLDVEERIKMCDMLREMAVPTPPSGPLN